MNSWHGTLFIVDDDSQSRKAVMALAASMKIPYEAFDSAEGFLESHDPARGGCVLCDYRLGGMDGLQLQERLQAIGGHLSFILVSAYADTAVAVRTIKNGAVAFIEKPYRNDALADAILKAMHGGEQHSKTIEKETPSEALASRTSEDLLASYAKSGDRSAFEELVHRFERELYSFLRGRIGDTQLAEDAFQATFLQLHLKCRQFQPERQLRPWLYTIANNQATDLLRRNKRHHAVSLDSPSVDVEFPEESHSLVDLLPAGGIGPSERLEDAENRQNARMALAKIPVKLREVLDLVAYQGLKHREAAKVLGIPLGTVKSRLNQGMRRLHKAVAELSSKPSFGKR